MAVKALAAGMASLNPETNHIKLLQPITAKLATQFAVEIKALIDTQDAANHLGLNKRMFEQLVRKKFIKSRRKTQHGAWKFTQGNLDEFVRDALSIATPLQKPDSDIKTIAETARRLGCKSEHIFELLLTGNLKTVIRLKE